ncbi:hypothetical protein [Mycoplasmopsis cynos]|uniref:hypothetical protein n=1 Tax=Mycoplasmopsis cynos TaxID=171284 RepID=UPI002201EA78|nr:hypothetical protein [Mycoplasmopsis cynos]UWV81605.1 hypothetical protein NW065_00225 [Mycoplasmopsis cynos]
MKKVADVEKLKLLAEEYIRVSKDLKELKKEMNNLVADTDIEINEHLLKAEWLCIINHLQRIKLISRC